MFLLTARSIRLWLGFFSIILLFAVMGNLINLQLLKEASSHAFKSWHLGASTR